MAQETGKGRRLWQGAWLAGLLAVAGTLLACGGASPGTGSESSALTSGEVAAAARALALSQAEIARRAKALLTDQEAIAYVEALAANFDSSAAAVDDAAAQLGIALTPSQVSQIIDATLRARQAWLDGGVGSDAAFLAQLAQDLAWLLDLLNQAIVPATLPDPLQALLDQLKALIASYRDLADALARERGVAPGTLPPVVVLPQGSHGKAAPSPHPRKDTSWGLGPSRDPGQTGANFGTSAYQQK